MRKRRFVAPERAQVQASVFAHPIFADYSEFLDLLAGESWPAIEVINTLLRQRLGDDHYRFKTQDNALLSDGLHYETRIRDHGIIATRERNWHDLFNALVWCCYPAIKLALNARQIAEITHMGPRMRNRAQYALTQFDEAGVIVRVRDPQLLRLWDRHDWVGLFYENADSWRNGGISIAAVIGHALLEHGLLPEVFVIGKCIAVVGETDADGCVAAAADAIFAGEILQDPLELRPLPLAGIPGWYFQRCAEDFYRETPCFSPLRAGREYPSALKMDPTST